MAAVYTVNGGRIETNVEELSVENKQPGVKKTVVSPLPTNAKIIKVEQSSEDEDSSNAEPTPTKRRPETAVMDAAPAIAIKEERIEEDEYVQIKLVDVDESLERTPNKESDRDNVDGDWLFRCVDCGEAFGQREAYLEHQREHVHDGPIVCLDSDAQWDDLLVSEDGGRRTLCCAICGRKFSSSRGFFTHQLKHRNQALKQEPGAEVAVPKQRLFECEYCGKTYSSIGLCLNHQRSHKQASKSVFHQLAHLKKKSFQCPTCGRSYSRASALDAHRRCHEVKLIKSRNSGAEKSLSTPEPVVENGDVAIVEDKKHKLLYECRECGRAFSTTTGLSTHQRFTSHSKCSEVKLKEDAKKSFSCSECDKSFLTSTALAIHQRWHIRRAKIGNSGQSFSCEECGKIFTSLTFYEKHQRVVHSGETPAKSFLHQVCQLKKKAFECQDCGRRFSRATALQSHQLCHTDVFGNATEKATQKPVTTPTSLSPPQKLYLCDKVKPESFAIGALVYSQETPQANQVSEDLGYNEADDHAVVDENEIDDLIVEVVSISGSDDSYRENEPEPVSESKTEPEMECDSHQEAKKGKVPLSLLDEAPLPLKSKAGADLEMDYEAKQVESERNPPQKTSFDCPECGRRFSSASAIRCHRLWHRGPMGRAASIKTWKRNAPTQAYLENGLYKCNECGKESTTLNSHYNHMRQHEDPKPYKSLSYQLAGLQKKNFKCEVCGLRFSRASALQSHQQHHAKQVRIERTHKCAHCEKSYSSYGALYNHRKACHSDEDKSDTAVSIKKEVFNPRKTLLGPKVYHCEQCGKGFWSFGAFSQHKQNQHCTEVTENNDTSEPLTSVNGHTRSISKRATCPICRKRFRHRGILACHMKRHRSIPQMNHTCKVCGKSYRMLTCFLKHQQVHDSEGIPPPVKSFEQQIEQLEKNTYSCPDCGKRFSRAMALQFHMRSHGYETGYPFSSLSNSDAQVFKCSFCPALFSVDTELQDHLSKKHSGCLSEVTEQTSELAQGVSNDSLKSVSDAPNRSLDCGKYQCKECGRRFSVIGALNFHKRIHRKSPTAVDVSSSPVSVVQETKCKEEGSESKGLYICPECGRSFGTNSALGTHRRWHTDKKFASTLSTDTSTSRKDKTVNEGPYRCNICRKGFFYYCVLRRHQMHHPESEAQTQPESSLESTQVSRSNPSSKISCPKCERSFPRASILATHYQTHHANVSDCDQCNLSFSSENDMLKHRSQVHSGEECAQLGEPVSEKPASTTSKKVKLKLHGCPDCGKRFYKVRGLRAHRWQMHRKSRKTVSSKTASKSFICTGCEKRYSSQGALYNHRKVCVVTERKLKSVEAEVQDPVPPPKLPEHTYKWLFKCHKCGKAFPSLERLEAHKDIAKSRPFCCALCCRGYWTETQLQQHLVWHDEVRRRLPADLRYRLSTFSAPTEVGPKSEDCVTQYTQDQTTAATTGTQSRVHYKCPHCEETFLNFLALQQHQTVHSMDDPYRCSLCPRTFSQIHELIDHHQECMSEKKERNENGGDSVLVDRARDGDGLTCIDCGITFSREVELHQHYIAHASVKLRSMRCQDCGQQFIRWEAFKIHLRQHEHEEEEQKIKLKLKKKPPNQEGKKMKKAGAGLDKDDKGVGGDDDVNDDETWFSSGWELNPSEVFKVRPRVAMLSAEERPVYGPSHKVYACSVCGKVYSYLESFKNHQKMHREKLPVPELFTCPECGRTFHRQANLILHLKTHNKPIVPENYKCDQCNKIFNSQQTWMAHKVIHTKKPYWCLSCAKGFKEAKGLDRHLLGHDLKRHKCDLCPKAFRVPAELRYHRNTHTGAKPYMCQMCKKTFSQLGNLITHRKKHVGVYKEGSETPIGGKTQSGNRRVTELKKLIVMAMDDVDMAEGEESTEPEEEVVEREESEAEFEEEEVEEAEAEVVEKEEGALKCFECGSWFSQESELHLHYMKHASGQL